MAFWHKVVEWLTPGNKPPVTQKKLIEYLMYGNTVAIMTNMLSVNVLLLKLNVFLNKEDDEGNPLVVMEGYFELDGIQYLGYWDLEGELHFIRHIKDNVDKNGNREITPLSPAKVISVMVGLSDYRLLKVNPLNINDTPVDELPSKFLKPNHESNAYIQRLVLTNCIDLSNCV